MGFFKELTTHLDRDDPTRLQSKGGGMSDMLKYAPTKLRVRGHQSSQFQGEKYWRERARRAETRLVHIEESIQRIAFQAAPRKGG